MKKESSEQQQTALRKLLRHHSPLLPRPPPAAHADMSASSQASSTSFKPPARPDNEPSQDSQLAPRAESAAVQVPVTSTTSELSASKDTQKQSERQRRASSGSGNSDGASMPVDAENSSGIVVNSKKKPRKQRTSRTRFRHDAISYIKPAKKQLCQRTFSPSFKKLVDISKEISSKMDDKHNNNEKDEPPEKKNDPSPKPVQIHKQPNEAPEVTSNHSISNIISQPPPLRQVPCYNGHTVSEPHPHINILDMPSIETSKHDQRLATQSPTNPTPLRVRIKLDDTYRIGPTTPNNTEEKPSVPVNSTSNLLNLLEASKNIDCVGKQNVIESNNLIRNRRESQDSQQSGNMLHIESNDAMNQQKLLYPFYGIVTASNGVPCVPLVPVKNQILADDSQEFIMRQAMRGHSPSIYLPSMSSQIPSNDSPLFVNNVNPDHQQDKPTILFNAQQHLPPQNVNNRALNDFNPNTKREMDPYVNYRPPVPSMELNNFSQPKCHNSQQVINNNRPYISSPNNPQEMLRMPTANVAYNPSSNPTANIRQRQVATIPLTKQQLEREYIKRLDDISNKLNQMRETQLYLNRQPVQQMNQFQNNHFVPPQQNVNSPRMNPPNLNAQGMRTLQQVYEKNGGMSNGVQQANQNQLNLTNVQNNGANPEIQYCVHKRPINNVDNYYKEPDKRVKLEDNFMLQQQNIPLRLPPPYPTHIKQQNIPTTQMNIEPHLNNNISNQRVLNSSAIARHQQQYNTNREPAENKHIPFPKDLPSTSVIKTLPAEKTVPQSYNNKTPCRCELHNNIPQIPINIIKSNEHKQINNSSIEATNFERTQNKMMHINSDQHINVNQNQSTSKQENDQIKNEHDLKASGSQKFISINNNQKQNLNRNPVVKKENSYFIENILSEEFGSQSVQDNKRLEAHYINNDMISKSNNKVKILKVENITPPHNNQIFNNHQSNNTYTKDKTYSDENLFNDINLHKENMKNERINTQTPSTIIDTEVQAVNGHIPFEEYNETDNTEDITILHTPGKILRRRKTESNTIDSNEIELNVSQLSQIPNLNLNNPAKITLRRNTEVPNTTSYQPTQCNSQQLASNEKFALNFEIKNTRPQPLQHINNPTIPTKILTRRRTEVPYGTTSQQERNSDVPQTVSNDKVPLNYENKANQLPQMPNINHCATPAKILSRRRTEIPNSIFSQQEQNNFNVTQQSIPNERSFEMNTTQSPQLSNINIHPAKVVSRRRTEIPNSISLQQEPNNSNINQQSTPNERSFEMNITQSPRLSNINNNPAKIMSRRRTDLPNSISLQQEQINSNITQQSIPNERSFEMNTTQSPQLSNINIHPAKVVSRRRTEIPNSISLQQEPNNSNINQQSTPNERSFEMNTTQSPRLSNINNNPAKIMSRRRTDLPNSISLQQEQINSNITQQSIPNEISFEMNTTQSPQLSNININPAKIISRRRTEMPNSISLQQEQINSNITQQSISNERSFERNTTHTHQLSNININPARIISRRRTEIPNSISLQQEQINSNITQQSIPNERSFEMNTTQSPQLSNINNNPAKIMSSRRTEIPNENTLQRQQLVPNDKSASNYELNGAHLSQLPNTNNSGTPYVTASQKDPRNIQQSNERIDPNFITNNILPKMAMNNNSKQEHNNNMHSHLQRPIAKIYNKPDIYHEPSNKVNKEISSENNLEKISGMVSSIDINKNLPTINRKASTESFDLKNNKDYEQYLPHVTANTITIRPEVADAKKTVCKCKKCDPQLNQPALLPVPHQNSSRLNNEQTHNQNYSTEFQPSINNNIDNNQPLNLCYKRKNNQLNQEEQRNYENMSQRTEHLKTVSINDGKTQNNDFPNQIINQKENYSRKSPEKQLESNEGNSHKNFENGEIVIEIFNNMESYYKVLKILEKEKNQRLFVFYKFVTLNLINRNLSPITLKCFIKLLKTGKLINYKKLYDELIETSQSLNY